MSNETVKNAGDPTMGDNIPFENLSADGANPLNVRRHAPERDETTGRFKVRGASMVGPLGPAGGVGDGGIESVSGRFIAGVRNNAVLMSDPLSFERVHMVTPNYAGSPPMSALLDDGSYPRHLRGAV